MSESTLPYCLLVFFSVFLTLPCELKVRFLKNLNRSLDSDFVYCPSNCHHKARQ